MSYNSESNRARNFKSALCFALGRPDYSLNCTPLGPITITNCAPLGPITITITKQTNAMRTSQAYFGSRLYEMRERFFFSCYFGCKKVYESQINGQCSSGFVRFVSLWKSNSAHSMHTFTIKLNNRRPIWSKIIAFRHANYKSKCRSTFF